MYFSLLDTINLNCFFVIEAVPPQSGLVTINLNLQVCMIVRKHMLEYYLRETSVCEKGSNNRLPNH